MNERKLEWEAMGCKWVLSVWDELDAAQWLELSEWVLDKTKDFDETYSRFKKTSLIWQLAGKLGVVEVPKELVAMLRYYQQFYELSDKKFNPLIGQTISDLGYDWQYSLVPKESIAPTPDLTSALRIVDESHIELKQETLIDLGGIGKGYWVDCLAAELRRRGVSRFLVNGSGDVAYESLGEVLRVGLEDPADASKIIGQMQLAPGRAMCSSGSNRRRWDKYHHIIDPITRTSPEMVVAAWVVADNATIADALASCLFLVTPENFSKRFEFEYCLLNNQRQLKVSEGFKAEFF
jgi:thiamine biosynthesis lipoprotein